MKENSTNLIEQDKIKEIQEEESEDKDKARLIVVLDNIKDKLNREKNKAMNEVYLSNSVEQMIENKEKRYKNINNLSKCLYKFQLFMITSAFLAGSFFIASLKKSFWNFFFPSLKCRLDIFCDKEDFKKKSNFFGYSVEQLLREPVDLNLIMFWNSIGNSLLNSIGFVPTSLILLFTNSLNLLLTYNIAYDDYDPEDCKYSFLKMLLLFFNGLFMVFSFGSSTLLAQQKLIDYYSLFDEESNEQEKKEDYIELTETDKNSDLINNPEDSDSIKINDKKVKLEEKIEKKEEDKNKNFDSMLLFGIANLFGYFWKNMWSIGAIGVKQEYLGTLNISNMHFNQENLDIINILYLNNSDIPIINNSNDTNNTNNTNKLTENQLNQRIFIIIGFIYFCCIIISVILYSIFFCCFFKNKEEEGEQKCCGKKKEKEKKSTCCLWNKACSITGFILYSEIVSLDKDIKNGEMEGPGCCQLCCEIINHYCY